MADRIEALGALHRSAGTANPLRARFEAAAGRLFGDGPRFKRYDPARAEAVRRVAASSGLSECAVRRNLPLFGTRARTPAEKVVEGFERAAAELGRVA